MASLYKKPVILNDPKTDKPVKTKSRKWWGRFKDEHGVERRVPLAVDKAAAQSMLNELVRRTERRAAGLTDSMNIGNAWWLSTRSHGKNLSVSQCLRENQQGAIETSHKPFGPVPRRMGDVVFP
ncbi:MAG: hypothetical protein ACK5MO_13045 [Planctomyces sp.]